MNGPLIIVCTLVFVVSVGVVTFWLTARHQRRLVESWLREKELTIIRMRRQVFPRGPYKVMPPAGNYGLYLVTVTDKANQEYRGWVRVVTKLIWFMPRFESKWEDKMPDLNSQGERFGRRVFSNGVR